MTESRGITSSQWLALVAILLGTFIAVLDNSLMNVALPKLMAIFGSSAKDIEWVVTGYMLASAVVVPTSGFLADRFGYKTIFLITVAFFTFGSALCGIAWSEMSLIIFRIIQGLGGGFIMPLGMAMIYQIIPRDKVQVALGVFGIAAMAAPAVGPTLGGYLVDHLSWRYLFLINIPIGIAAVIVGLSVLKETPKREGLKFDYIGTMLSMILFTTLLLALSEGSSEGWTSPYIVSLFFVSTFSFLLFIWVELGTEHALLDLRMFKNPVFTISTICSSFVMIALQGGVFLMPMFFQNVQGLSPMETGLVMMPQSIAMAIMMPVSGKLASKFGVVPLAVSGLIIMGITTFELGSLNLQTSNHWLELILAIRGIGIGLCMMPISSAAMNTMPNHQIARASSLSNVFRNVAASFGIAVLTSIMTNRQTLIAGQLSDQVNNMSPALAQFQTDVAYRYLELGADVASSKSGYVSVLMGLIQKEALVRALADTLLITAVPAFISIIFILLIKEKKKPDAADGQKDAQAHVMVEM
ncbi:DHA2 family efflux MFS transporter permease subunit [Paenibacillus sp. y28]|uniref:DHA2 family efflux MFS transporter permease subunit n=1 Tax=Paenibacillus sp. y28 TaxID=3129110 RepID=UPI003017A4BC